MTNTSLPHTPAEAQAYLAAIITSSDDAIISKDLSGNITSWNPAAERIFGYTAAEAIGKHITLIIPSDRLSEENKITVSPIRDASGNVIGASKISRDISDRIQSEAALKDLSRKKDEFMANMSHELRTPMNAVIGISYILQRLDGMPEQAKKFIDTLKLSAENLMELINDLLDFAKIDSGSFEIETIEFSLAEQVEKAISIANVKASEKNLSLYVNYPPSLNRYYMGDPLRIHQVLMNLLSNAVKFTDHGSIEVDISGALDDDTDTTLVTIKVHDTGIGIAEDKLATVFDKFMQGDTSITRRYGGSGLGLAISKACVEKMGGSIKLDSELGVGTTFTMTLPPPLAGIYFPTCNRRPFYQTRCATHSETGLRQHSRRRRLRQRCCCMWVRHRMRICGWMKPCPIMYARSWRSI